MERHSQYREGQGADTTGKYRPRFHRKREKTEMARARSANGRQKNCQDKLYASGLKRKLQSPQKNWIDIIQQDLKSIGMTWEVAQQFTVDSEGWRRRVVQCVFDTA